MPICASVFNRRIELWRNQATTPNGFGEIIPEWVKVTDLWAAVNNRSAQERTGAGRTEASTAEVFTVRYAQVTVQIDPASYSIRYGGRSYNINSKTEVGFREAFDIIAEARADD